MFHLETELEVENPKFVSLAYRMRWSTRFYAGVLNLQADVPLQMMF